MVVRECVTAVVVIALLVGGIFGYLVDKSHISIQHKSANVETTRT